MKWSDVTSRWYILGALALTAVWSGDSAQGFCICIILFALGVHGRAWLTQHRGRGNR